MTPRRAVLRSIVIAALVATGLAPLSAAFAVPDHLDLHFDVSYDGREIGTHRFEIRRDGSNKAVRSEAAFSVRLMFVTLYRYEHVAQEHWSAGCLRTLQSRTNDNGSQLAVNVDQDAYAAPARRAADEARHFDGRADCPGTFAYWDVAALQRDALVNSQTGELTPVRLEYLGAGLLDGIHSDRYRLHAEGLDPIDLWYRSSDGLWLRLETRRDGRLLLYRLNGIEDAAQLSGLTPADT